MEGKQALLKWFADVNANILLVDTAKEWSQSDTDAVKAKIVRAVEDIRNNYGNKILVMLEDVAAPVCFDVEKTINGKGIPILHDDQHGTAITVVAGVINALKKAGKNPKNTKIVINGAGASGIAVARLLNEIGVGEIICFDSKGAISTKRKYLNFAK